MAITLTIAGAAQTARLFSPEGKRESIKVSHSFEESVAEFPIYDKDSTSGAYRPDVDDRVVITDGSQTIFDGIIVSVRDVPRARTNAGVVTRVRAHGGSILDRFTVVQTYAAGQTLKEILTHLFDFYINPNIPGISLDAGMADGPTMGAVSFDQVSLREAWARLMELTGYIIRLTPAGVIEAFEVGDKTAAFSLTKANGLALGEVTWEKQRGTYANRVYVRYGPQTLIDKTDTFTGDGSTTEFALTYTAAALPSYLTQGGVFVGINTSWTITDNAIVFDSAPSNGQAISITYPVQFPERVSAEDAGEISSVGLWEATFDAPEIEDATQAQALADGLLRKLLDTPRIVSVRTRETPMPLPGDVITLAFEDRLVSGTYLITHVSATDVVQHVMEYKLTCVSGGEVKQSLREQLRSAVGGGIKRAGGVVTGSIAPAPSGRFVSEVVSYAGLADVAQHQSRLGTHANATAAGPALVLGRDDSEYGWAIVADMTDTIRGLYFIPFQESGTYRFAMRLTQGPSPADAVYYLTPNGNVNGQIFLGAPSALFGPGHRITGGYFTDLDVTNGMKERGRSIANGVTIVPTFDSGDYTASGAGSWGVDSGDVVNLSYTFLSGKRMRVEFTIAGTDVSGTPAQLRIAIPAGNTANRRTDGFVRYQDAGATPTLGVCFVEASGTTINIEKLDGSAFSNTTSDNTSVVGFIEFEVQ